VNLMFLLPSLGYGLFLFLANGTPVLLILSLLTLSVWLVVGGQRKVDNKAEVSILGGRIYLGDRRLNLLPWSWSTETRNVVYQALHAPRPKSLSTTELTPAQLGVNHQGVVQSPIGTGTPHAIIIGQTGSGKTQLIKRLMSAFAGEIWVIDPKGGADFQEILASRVFIGVELDAAAEAVAELIQIRQQVPGEQLLIVVDELAEACRQPKLMQVLEQLTAKGRSLGLHFVGASQTMSGIPRGIWINCHSKFALRADPSDRAQLGFPIKPLGTASGEGYAELLIDQVTQFWFPFQGSTGAVEAVVGNPLLARVLPRPAARHP